MLCNSCGCIYCHISLYQNISVYHRISFHTKLTAHCGASDQFDLKLEITACNAESKEEVKLFVKMMSSCLSEVNQLSSEVNVKLCEANAKLSKSFEVKSRRKLLPRVQMILSELEWMVDISNEEDVSVSSHESLSWDYFNEKKCEMSETWELGDHNNSEVSSIASISSSPTDVEEKESLEDVFQTMNANKSYRNTAYNSFLHSSPNLTLSCQICHYQLLNCPQLLYSQKIDGSSKSM